MAGEFVLSRRGRGDPRFQFGVDRIGLVAGNQPVQYHRAVAVEHGPDLIDRGIRSSMHPGRHNGSSQIQAHEIEARSVPSRSIAERHDATRIVRSA